MVSCEIENENGIDKLKWIKLEEEKPENITQSETDLTAHVLSESNVNLTSESNLNLEPQTKTYLLENSPNTLFDLYPPDKVDSQDNKKEEPPKIKPKKTKTQKDEF